MFRLRAIWPAVILVGALQSAALAWMVSERVGLINNGREIVLNVIPVDPRSLFRGDYVILNFDFSTLKTTQVPKDLRSNEQVFVTLQKAPNGSWAYISMSRAQPAQLPKDRIAMRGRVKSVWRNRKTDLSTIRLRFGIESYFVPEGTGKALEKQVRDSKIRAIVAVSGTGVAAIKGLEVAGKRLLDPPLF